LKLDSNGTSFIKNNEGGCFPTVYDDGFGVLTAGWGHKLKEGDPVISRPNIFCL
jgi:GH24 family phage-related lysozyme (muramidase)